MTKVKLHMTLFLMRVSPKDSFDPSLDYQLINCGNGVLETYALGEKTGSYLIGEIAMRHIEHMIASLDDAEAQQLVQTFIENINHVHQTLRRNLP